MRAVEREWQERHAAWSAWDSQIEKLEQQWKSLASQYDQGFAARKALLESHKARYQNLQSDYKAERQTLELNVEAEQRLEFLTNHNLEDYDIDGIGAGLKEVLCSYGIETADQLIEADIMAVPGFGPVRVRKLVEWRRCIERNFRFDPKTGIPKERLAVIELKYAQLRQSCEIELQQGPEALQTIAANAARHCGEILKKIQDVLVPLAQAEANLSLIHLESE